MKKKKIKPTIKYLIIILDILFFLLISILSVFPASYQKDPIYENFVVYGYYYFLIGFLGIPFIIVSIVSLFQNKVRRAYFSGIFGAILFSWVFYIAGILGLIHPDISITLSLIFILILSLGLLGINLMLIPYLENKKDRVLKYQENVQQKQQIEIQKQNQELERKKKELDYIKSLPSIYESITFEQIKDKLGIKMKDLRDLLEKMILSKELPAKINGNNVIFQIDKTDQGKTESKIQDSLTEVNVSPQVPSESQVLNTETSPTITGNISIQGLKNKKVFFWVIPLIASLLVLISLFTPAISHNIVNAHIWMWGFVLNYFNQGFGFLETSYLIPSIILSLIITLVHLFVIFTAYQIRIGKKDEGDLIYISCAIITIVLCIIWISIISLISEYLWFVSSPNFGIYGPFIGSILLILITLSKRYIFSKQ